MALPLKSGADLYNQQLIRAAIWNNSADVLDPKEYATGLMYFNTNPSSNMYQKLRFRTGTDWKTIAFAEDLDVATNKDFQALKEKVELLSGEVDTDAIINNMKEVTAFLEGFAEDANLMEALNKKLDKTGGVIDGTLMNPLTIKTSAIEVGIPMSVNNSVKMWVGWNSSNGAYIYNSTKNYYLGIKDDGTPHFNNNTLLHSGNYSDYAAHSLQGIFKGDFNANDCYNTSYLVKFYSGLSPKSENVPISKDWNNGLLELGLNANGSVAQFFFAAGKPLYYRASNTGDWKQIAFTDSTVEAAKRLETASGILEGFTLYPTPAVYGIKLVNGDSSSRFGFYSYETGKYASIVNTKNDIENCGLQLNDNGNIHIFGKNVLIGATNDNGAKLQVNGAIAISGIPQGDTPALLFNNGGGEYFDGRGNLTLSANSGSWNIFDQNHFNVLLRVQRTGNVLIGATNDNGAKLQVNGDIAANGTIACKGVAAEGSAPVGTVDKWAGSIAIGTKSQTYTHALGTTDITVAIYEKNGNEWVQILTDVDIVNANTIRVTFGANTTVEHRIVVMG